MQTRRFGRTGHLSTIAILGAFCFSQASQEETDAAMQTVMQAGVNHIDVAPSYGHAEQRLGPWMARARERFFLGCKTMQRTREAAAVELRESLECLQTPYFDLYQIHAIETMVDLDLVTRPGGALEALIEARQAGLTRFIGITGHGFQVPVVFLEALRRFDFDAVLFPLNFVQYANPTYRQNSDELLRQCRQHDVGVMVIKSITRAPWEGRPQQFITWYEPFTDPEHVQIAVNFALSQDVTGLCTAGDLRLLPLVLQACQNFTPMSQIDQQALIATAGQYKPLFT